MIEPDTKDWTWVLERPCPECGFDSRDVRREQVAGLLRANAAGWPSALSRTGDPGRRPTPDKWSPLEYACHVRDACRRFDERLALMLTQDAPRYPNWDQDRTAVEDRYADQNPDTVLTDLRDAAESLAVGFDSVSGEQWHRTGTRSDGAHFTVETFARYFVHDPIHHLYDVTGIPAA